MTIRKRVRFATVAVACLALGLVWLRAQDTGEPAPAEPAAAEGEEAVPADKWKQIKKNNEKMTKSLEQVEQNLNFVKARSMAGGRG